MSAGIPASSPPFPPILHATKLKPAPTNISGAATATLRIVNPQELCMGTAAIFGTGGSSGW